MGFSARPCGRRFPLIRGVPRLLPDDMAAALLDEQPDFFPAIRNWFLQKGPTLAARSLSIPFVLSGMSGTASPSVTRYTSACFAGTSKALSRCGGVACEPSMPVAEWAAGSISARREGAEVEGWTSAAPLTSLQQGKGGALVQADLRHPPFPPASFDLVYSLGVSSQSPRRPRGGATVASEAGPSRRRIADLRLSLSRRRGLAFARRPQPRDSPPACHHPTPV